MKRSTKKMTSTRSSIMRQSSRFDVSYIDGGDERGECVPFNLLMTPALPYTPLQTTLCIKHFYGAVFANVSAIKAASRQAFDL